MGCKSLCYLLSLLKKMQEFNTIQEAFEWFMENKLEALPVEERRRLKDVKYNYYTREGNVSEKRMLKVLNDYGNLETIHRYKFGN